MAPLISPVETSNQLPKKTTVVIIGGGIVGLTAALCLSEQGIPTVVLEKGRLAGEQSSRNLGWVRKMGRAPADVPMSLAADRLWKTMPERTGFDVGYRQAGIMYLSRSAKEMEFHRNWLEATKGLNLDSRLVSQSDIDQLVPNGKTNWEGGIFTPSDGRAEPTLASSAIAKAAIARGVTIVENCAVRCLSLSAGKVTGIVTEAGEIACDQVLLAGGLWSRRFLGNHGIDLPTLPLVCSVVRTAPMDGPTDIAVGAPDFSFRKRQDGGFTITQRGALIAPLTSDHLRLGMRYLPMLKGTWNMLHLRFGKESWNDLRMARRWKAKDKSPFEMIRTMDPASEPRINKDAMNNLIEAWPDFSSAVIEQSWAGMMDITPDSLPVICQINQIPGLTIATGFSGHGFGTAPAAGQLAAEIVTGMSPCIDPKPYQLSRFRPKFQRKSKSAHNQ